MHKNMRQVKHGGVMLQHPILCYCVRNLSTLLKNPHPGGTFPKSAESLTLWVCLYGTERLKVQVAPSNEAVLKRPL